MTSQSPGSPNRDNFGTPFGSPRTKSHSDMGAVEGFKEYYMGEGDGFPRVRPVVSLVSPKLLVVYFSTKGAPKNELTNLLVRLMQVQVNN
jgi:hypothetical protein